MEVLFATEEIAARVGELGRQISADYRGRELVLIGVLNGAFILLADLARTLTIPVRIDFIRVASYGNAACSSGQVSLRKDVELDLHGRHLLLVEDIVDSGRTLACLREHFQQRGAASLAVCALIDKRERREVDLVVDYPGFQVESGFLVGYGLDYAEDHRQYPAVYRIREESLQ